MWFNPPFNLSVRTKIGKIFFNLLEQNFPKKTKLCKIFNKNNVNLVTAVCLM